MRRSPPGRRETPPGFCSSPMDDREAIPVGQYASSAVYPHRTDDYETITVVQGTPVDVGPSPPSPSGRPVSGEAQARRYMPLETSGPQESTGQRGLQCVLVVLRAPVAALLAINYALGYMLYSLCMAVAAALLLLAQVTSVPFYAIFRTSRQFSSHCAELCSLSRQARMLAPHPVGIRAIKALARWARGGDAAFRDVIGWTSETGCSCIFHMARYNPYNFACAWTPVLILLALPAAYAYWLFWVLIPQATDEDDGLDVGGATYLVGAALAIVAACGCVAAACGADEQGVAATTAATAAAAVAVPALFVYVCLPLLHAGQEAIEWEEDHPSWAPLINWSGVTLLLLLVCACVACCCG